MLIQRKPLGLFGACLLLGAQLAFAEPPMIFQHLGSPEGLPQNTVMSTLQDSQGFIWIATEDGLVRYDGYELRRYEHERGNPDSLPGNYIWSIAEDQHGDLWLAIKNTGLARWNRHTDRFTAFRHDPAHPGFSPSSDAVRQLLIDRHGHLWLATTGGGLNEFDPVAGSFKVYRNDPARTDTLSSDVVTALWQTPAGELWVGTDDGLNRRLPASDRFVRFPHAADEPGSLSSNRIAAIRTDRRGRLWVGTFDGGLNMLDTAADGFTAYRHDSKRAGSLPHDEVRAVLEDRAGRVWIGTAAGLALFDERSGSFDVYARDPTEPTSLRDNYVMSLFEDRAGLMWVGTRAGGVSRWDPRTWSLGHQKPAWISSGFVNAFAEDGRGGLWVGTLGDGLARLDISTGRWTPFDRIRRAGASLGDRRIMALLNDSRGNLWIGTMGGGLSRLSPGGELKTWRAAPGQPQALPADGIMALHEDSTGRIWIGTFGGGVSIHDPVTGLFQNVPYDPKDPKSLGSPIATAIAEDNRGNFWIATDGGGLNIVRPNGTVAANFRHNPDDLTSLGSDTVYALHVDAKGRIWAGTEGGGLNLTLGSSADSGAVRFKTISQAEGLTSNVIYGIGSDEKQGLWLSGNAGVMRYDPQTGEVRSFHREHGLQGEEFNFGAHLRMRDGHMLFGGANGFNMIVPAELEERSKPPPLVLTGVEIMNKPAAVTAPYPLLANLQLGYRDSVVSFDFAALDFAAPSKTRYAYRLHGFDPDFVELRHGHRVSYTNLAAGEYLLEINAASGDGVWSSSSLRLPIKVDPAPWRTWWAYLIYAAAFGMLLWSWYLAQRRKLAAAAEASRRLEAEVVLRTRDLEERNVELARVNRTKGDFLARMSHEIRTPMNGVLGTAELLTRTALSTRQTQLASTIQTSARTLLDILNDILDLAKVDAGKLSLEVVPFDLASVIEETVELLAPQAQAKQLEVIVSAAPELGSYVLGDPLRVRQLLTNLIGNAIKFTSRGQIVVTGRVLERTPDAVQIELAVSDTGIGMTTATVTRVFEPFTQADESTTRRFGGTGLGLAICRELVALMGGRIETRSEPDVGSVFTATLRLPLGGSLDDPGALSLRAVTVKVASRRPALVDALMRQCQAWGASVEAIESERDLECAIENGSSAARGADAEVVVIDAESFQREVTALLARPPGAGPQNIACICASGGDLRHPLEARLGEEKVVCTPFRQSALRTALCVAAGLRPSLASAAAHSDALPRFGARVLVVEDSPVNQMVAEGFLTTLGCSVTCVSNGRDAVMCANTESYGLILMDLQMPEMDGFTATGLIRKAEPAGRRVPIVALTANATTTQRAACLAAGMDDFLGKPFALADLQAVLRRWLSSQGRSAAPDLCATFAPESTGPNAVLDRNALAGIRAYSRPNQASLLPRLVPVFTRTSQAQLDGMREALARRDYPTIRNCAHALKSAAGNLGAVGLAAAARDLEDACLAADASRIGHLVAEVFRLQPAAVAALEQEVRAQSA